MQSDDKAPEDALVQLLRISGRRALPPDEVSQRVYDHSRKVWESQLQRRRARSIAWKIAAGLILFAVVSGWWWNQGIAPEFGVLEAGTDVQLYSSGQFPYWERSDAQLRVGGSVVTGSTGARIRRSDGVNLRLGAQSRLRLTSLTAVALEKGKLFVDTGRHGAHSQVFVVSTPFGQVEHIGTQFLVNLDIGECAVAVRQGRVRLTSERAQQLLLDAGEALRIGRDGSRHKVPVGPFDPAWQWADALARPVSIDQRSLDAVLADVAARSGLELSYADHAASQEAHRIVLHGPDLLLSPRIALDAALAGTNLAVQVRERSLIVQKR